MTAIVGTRLAASAALFILLVAAQAAFGEWFSLLVALGLVVIPALSWVTFWFFARRAVAHPNLLALRVQVQDALALAIASSVAGLLGLYAVGRALQLLPTLDRSVFVIFLTFVLLMIAAPAVNWLVVWRPWRPE